MAIYFGKISEKYPEQLEEGFYAAGDEGSSWYGGIKPGDYVFPIFKAKIDRIWKVKEYANKPNRILKENSKVCIFEVVKMFKEPVRLSVEFIRYKYFETDLNLLNKSSKMAKNCGFFPISISKDCPDVEAIEFANNLRNIYIVVSGTERQYKYGDIRVLINNIDEARIASIGVFEGTEFKTYDILLNLYNERNKKNERYSLKELLSYSKKDNATKKEKYLNTVLDDLDKNGVFAVDNPIDLYDNILVGRKRSAPSKSSKVTSKEENIDLDEDILDDLDEYEKYADLLNFNPNLILYGPPGTGKTYGAMKIIEAFDKKHSGKFTDFKAIENTGRVKFVTFHQSYSYEEFIEGIKPVIGNDQELEENEKSSLAYNIEDGILKQIAKSAATQILKQNAKVKGMENTTENSKIWKVSLGNRNNNDLYNQCKKASEIAIGWLEGHNITDLTYNDMYDLLVKNRKAGDGSPRNAANCLNAILNNMNEGDIVLVYDSPTTVRDIGIVTSDYFFAEESKDYYPHRRKVTWAKEFKNPASIFEYNSGVRLTLKTIYELDRMSITDINELIKEGEESKELENNLIAPYYLIIDEINRGNVSKIFGELITLIEKDKRERISCYLPYSKKKFTLPSNLYIIGTMNTADRSIAVLDTALRRRFAFIEIEPDLAIFNDPTLVSSAKVNDTVDIPKLLGKLNEKITEKIDRDHRIGHSYFMDIIGLNQLYKVWYYNIIPLLTEYFYNDIETLKSLIGDCFFDKHGSVVFLNTKGTEDNMSEFEEALLKIITVV
jgi:5-methylcytosine-specific restriction protein B